MFAPLRYSLIHDVSGTVVPVGMNGSMAISYAYDHTDPLFFRCFVVDEVTLSLRNGI